MPTSNATNVARARRAGVAGLAGFALAILPASLAEAAYGPKTKIGANYQQTSNTQSTDAIAEGSCGGESFCYVLFQRASAQKALIVQHVSCLVSINAGDLRYGSLQTRKGQDFPFRFTHLVPVPTAGGPSLVNSPVMHLVEPGERPYIFFSNSAAAGWSAECTISGRLQ